MAYELKDSQGNPVLKDGRQIYAADTQSVVKGVDLEKRTLSIIGTTEGVDRDGDIIRVRGWNLDNYLKNPVFLWAHNYSSVPIGGSKKIFRRRDPKHIEHLVRFPSREGLFPFADMILELYHERLINASSVGFFPSEFRRRKPAPEDTVEAGKGKDDEIVRIERVGNEYLKQELLELSGCPVPSNPEALQNMMKGFKAADEKQKEWFIRMATEWEEPKNIDDIKEAVFQLTKEEVEVEDEDAPVKVFVHNETGKEICTVVDEEKKEGSSLQEIWGEFYSRGLVHCFFDDQVETARRVAGGRTLHPPSGDKAETAGVVSESVWDWAQEGEAGTVDWGKYRKAYAWFDTTDPENTDSYKLQVAEVLEGELILSWPLVEEAMEKLNGEKGGVDIPDGDRVLVYLILSNHYVKAGKTPPPLKSFFELLKSATPVVVEPSVSVADSSAYWDKILEGVTDKRDSGPKKTPSVPAGDKDKDDKGTASEAQSVDALGLSAEGSSWFVEQIRGIRQKLRKV